MDAKLIEGIAGVVALLSGLAAAYLHFGMAFEARKASGKLAFFLNPYFSDDANLTPRGREIRSRFVVAFSIFAAAWVVLLLAQVFG